jgi:hypothetical protein
MRRSLPEEQEQEGAPKCSPSRAHTSSVHVHVILLPLLHFPLRMSDHPRTASRCLIPLRAPCGDSKASKKSRLPVSSPRPCPPHPQPQIKSRTGVLFLVSPSQTSEENTDR